MTTIMKKFLIPSSVSWNEFCCNSIKTFRVLLYSTQTLTPNRVAAATGGALYHRLVQSRDPSVVPVLDQWVAEGRAVEQEDLQQIIKQIRKFGRFKHALQIRQWMNDKPYLDITHKDISVELDLISKVHGLKRAEEYFNNIPNSSRVWQVYGALLNCYADANSLAKAEATMQKMRELGYSLSLTYNVMMGLYSANQKYNELDVLMEEMEQKGIRIDKFTYAIRLNAYAKTSEIMKMESLLLKMEADPEVQMAWHAYTTVANGYLKAGEVQKALTSLKKSEYLIKPSQRKPAYENLLTLYASAGRKDEVYRVWNLYKSLGKFYNHGYICLLSSLAKLDCIEDVEKIYDEWESGHRFFDFQVPNLLVTVYCKKGLMEKAETLVKKLVESGKEPNGSTWSRMALGYFKNDRMEEGVEAMRKSLAGGFSGSLSICLDYLKREGRVDEAEEIVRLLWEKGQLSEADYTSVTKKFLTKPVIEI